MKTLDGVRALIFREFRFFDARIVFSDPKGSILDGESTQFREKCKNGSAYWSRRSPIRCQPERCALHPGAFTLASWTINGLGVLRTAVAFCSMAAVFLLVWLYLCVEGRGTSALWLGDAWCG